MKNIFLILSFLIYSAKLFAIQPFNKIINSYVIETNKVNYSVNRITVLNQYNNNQWAVLEYKQKSKHYRKYWVCFIDSLISEKSKTLNSENFQILLLKNHLTVFNKSNKTFRIVNRKKCKVTPKPWFLNPIDNKTIHIKEAKDSSLIQELAQFITYGITTDKRKVKALSTFITQNLSYDDTYTNYYSDFFELFSIEKSTLCGGYSRIFKTLCDGINIPCLYSTGYTKTSFNDYSNLFVNHAWNYIQVDSVWYGYDLTWDDSDSYDWIHIPLNDFNYSHFTDVNEHQYLNTKSFQQFAQEPYVRFASNFNIDFIKLLNSNTLFCRDTLYINIDTKTLKSITLWPENIIESSMSMDIESKTRTYTSESNLSFSIKGGEAYVSLSNFINPITLEFKDGSNIKYIVINGSRTDFFNYLITNYSKSDLISLSKALIASIVLEDEKNLIKLTNSKLTLKKSLSIKKFLIKNQLIKNNIVLTSCIHNMMDDTYSMVINNSPLQITFKKIDNTYTFDSYSYEYD